MNAIEASVFRPSPFITSQERGVNPSQQSGNPLNQNCSAGGGKRQRAIGTLDEVKGVSGQSDGIGYAFFSYERMNGKNIGDGGNIVYYPQYDNGTVPYEDVKYLQLNGVDPINASYTTGAIPICGSVSNPNFSCAPATPGATFPNLRNGTYQAWSEYRVITDSTGQANAQALVNKAEYVVDHTLPDFVPFSAACGVTASKDEPGLSVYREHFTIDDPSTISPPYGIAPTGANNGSIPGTKTCGSRSLVGRSLGGATERGGDVGGTIVYTAPGANPVNTIETSPVHY